MNHPLPTDGALNRAADPASAPRRERADALRAPAAAFCGFLAFAVFLPYPALPVGNTSALQLGNALVLLLAIPALLVSWKRRPFWVFPVLLAPMCLSTLKAAFVGADPLDVCLKATIVWGVSMMTVLAAQLCAPRHALPMLLGVAAAALLHAALGLFQLYRFKQGGDFPLPGLYVNPSFLSVQDNATIIARYVQRPFGLFPEPSAMAASLAPWVLILLALAFGLLRLRDGTPQNAPPSPGTPGDASGIGDRPRAGRGEGPVQSPIRNPQSAIAKTLTPTLSRRTGRGGNATAALSTPHRLFFGAAGLAGLGLIIVSRSGHAAPTCLAVVALVIAWFARARATAGTFLAVLVVFGIFLPVVVALAAVSVGERLGGKTAFGNSSWGERADSLAAGFDLIARSDLTSNLLGMGIGQMSPRLKESAGLDAVFSVLLTYAFETGVVGALAAAAVAYLLLRCWIAARYDLTFALVFGVWLVGVTVITSYEPLLPIWFTLGWMTVWPEVFAPRRDEGGDETRMEDGGSRMARRPSRHPPSSILHPRSAPRVPDPSRRGTAGELCEPAPPRMHLLLTERIRGGARSSPRVLCPGVSAHDALPHGRDARATLNAPGDTGVPLVRATWRAIASLVLFTPRGALA